MIVHFREAHSHRAYIAAKKDPLKGGARERLAAACGSQTLFCGQKPIPTFNGRMAEGGEKKSVRETDGQNDTS